MCIYKALKPDTYCLGYSDVALVDGYDDANVNYGD